MINIKLDDSHISINDNCRSKKSILEKLSQLLSKSSGINDNEILYGEYDNKVKERINDYKSQSQNLLLGRMKIYQTKVYSQHK